MEQQGVGGGGAPAQGCVVMVYGLDPDKMNCDKVFNLFCLYGNVIRVSLFISCIHLFNISNICVPLNTVVLVTLLFFLKFTLPHSSFY